MVVLFVGATLSVEGTGEIGHGGFSIAPVRQKEVIPAECRSTVAAAVNESVISFGYHLLAFVQL